MNLHANRFHSGDFPVRVRFDRTEQTAKKFSSFLKCRSWNAERTMNQQINHMNAAEDYLAKTSQRDLAAEVLKQAAQDFATLPWPDERRRTRTVLCTPIAGLWVTIAPGHFHF
jgi:hypothetical protein